MSERLTAPSANGTGVSTADEFYVRRINWLVPLGRADLIDEIADDCERRRTMQHAGGPETAPGS